MSTAEEGLRRFKQASIGERLNYFADEILHDGLKRPWWTYLWHWSIWFTNYGTLLAFLAFWPATPSTEAPVGRLKFAKFMVWQHLAEAIGCRQGPFNGHYGLPNNWKYRLARGTLKCSLLPQVFGSKRTLMDVAVHLSFFAFGFAFLASPVYGWVLLWLLCACDVWIFLSDMSQFYASTGHGYWTMLLSLCFPMSAGQLAGVQLALIFQWFFSGLGKAGPWFDYVNGPFIVQSMLLQVRGLRSMVVKLLFKSEADMSPSTFGRVLGQLAAAAEWGAPIALMVPHRSVALAGLVVITAMHVYILLMPAPFDVYSWNTCYLCAGLYLFYGSGCTGFDWSGLMRMHSCLLTVLVAEFALCWYGQFYPNKVGYYLSHRYWAGNWVMVHCLARRTEAVHEKLNRVASFAPNPVSVQAAHPETELFHKAMLYKSLGYLWLATFNMKCMARLLEKAISLSGAPESEMEFIRLPEYCLGEFRDLLYWEQAMPAIQKEVGFDDGECLCIVFGSFGLFRESATWKIVDMKRGIVEQGVMTREALKQMHASPSKSMDEAISLSSSSATSTNQAPSLLEPLLSA